jgi:L-asparaginase
MLRNPGKPITLTGSQIPSERPGSDAPSNLATAVAALEHGIKGVSVSFFRKVINGTRAVKVNTGSLDAFASVGALPMAFLDESGLSVRARETRPGDGSTPSLETDICPDVCLIKLVPGTNPAIFNAMADVGYRGMVVEAFGAGGVHNAGRDLAASIGRTVASGIPVVVCSQCLEGRVDLPLYEVGRGIMDSGVIPAGDMTTEAAVAKLMWALGRVSDIGEIEKIFNTDYAGEITL